MPSLFCPLSLCPFVPGFFIQERLQDEHGGDLVDCILVFLAGAAGFIQDLVGLAGGEALVPHVNGKTREFAEFGGELPHFFGARAHVPGQMQWVADHDGGDRKTAGQAGNGAEIIAAVAVNFESEDGLGCEAKFVGDGNADAFGADIEAEIAGR